jgi:hypothetical protein
MGYLKQGEVNGNGKRGKKGKQPTKEQPVPPIVVNLEADAGLGGIEVAIDELARAIRFYVDNAARGENMMKVFTGEEGAGYYPVLIALDPCSETTQDMLALGGRIATAFERIADALAGTTASTAASPDGGGVKS